MSFKLHKEQKEAVPDELLLFDFPRAQTSVLNYTYAEYRPIAPIGENSSGIEFNIPATGDLYSDMRNMSVYVKCRIDSVLPATLETPGWTADTKLSVINNFGHSLFREIEVYCNQKSISVNNFNYHHVAYLKTLLESSYGATKSHLSAQLFFKDRAGQIDNTNPRAYVTSGSAARYKIVRLGKTFDMEFKPYIDISSLDRYMVNGVNFRLRLHRNRDELLLMVDPSEKNEFKVVILDCVLRIPVVKVSPGIILSHTQLLSEGKTMIYPIIKSEIRSFTIESGSSGYNNNNLFAGGYIPKKVVVCMVSSDAQAGNLTKSPFNYQDYNLRTLTLSIGEETACGIMYQPEYSNEAHVIPYLNNFKANGKWDNSESLAIERYDFKLGYCIYTWQLDPIAVHMGSSLQKRQNARIAMNFSEPLSESITLLVYSESDRLLQLDNSRGVIYDIN